MKKFFSLLAVIMIVVALSSDGLPLHGHNHGGGSGGGGGGHSGGAVSYTHLTLPTTPNV